MPERSTIVAGYDTTAEAADGLSLARLLGQMTRSELVVSRVLEGLVSHPEFDPTAQRAVRDAIGTTRSALMAALPDDSNAQIVPVLDVTAAHGLRDAACSHDVAMLVVGSSHHSRLGRTLIGGSADLLVGHAPCPLAVAPPGFRDAKGLEPSVVGCAYDGTEVAEDGLRTAAYLAHTAALPLRVLTAAKPAEADAILAEAGDLVRSETSGEVETIPVALHGDAASALIAESGDSVGLLVMGSRGHGPVRRALLGSVAAHVIHQARCPVIVMPHHA